MTAKVKICGINDAAALDAATGGGADWVGFNFFEPSPRYVTPAHAAELSARLQGGGPQRVGVFVDPTVEAIATTLETVRLDVLQLYGAQDIPALRSRFGLPIWRAVGVATAADLPDSANGADRLLIEPRPPPGATRPGGNAAQLDWSLLHGWSPAFPWILAGGLTPDNVAGAIRISRASAVDVSSGVERAPGVKDPELIRDFIVRARSSGVRFRRATPADSLALGRMHVEAWREAYPDLLPGEILASLDPSARAAMWQVALERGAEVHLAELGDAIVGFGSSGSRRDPTLPCSGEIYAIYVLRVAQRLGVGRALMSAMAHDLLAQGHRSAALWVLEGNTPGRQFYQALGGREIARRNQEREAFTAIGIAYGWDDLTVLI